ncbi:hypothetical protein ES707_14262 [subsurface metagenome]
MVAYSYQRGHKIKWHKNRWIYSDNGESIEIERPCKRCGKMPTKEGYDACLGYIKGARSACCGHGLEKGFILYD